VATNLRADYTRQAGPGFSLRPSLEDP